MPWKNCPSHLAKSIAAITIAHNYKQRRPSQRSACQSLISFGIIADVQYADADDSGQRHFRNSLQVLKNARMWWSKHNLAFVVHAGDLIDERASKQGSQASEEAFAAVAKEFPDGKDVLCLIGNHELYNFSREGLKAISAQSPCHFVNAAGKFYYRYEPVEAVTSGWRFLILDPYDLSVMSQGRGHGLDQSALGLMAANNPNFKPAVGKNHITIHDLNAESIDDVKIDWFKGRGSTPNLLWRWVPVNGAISEEQLRWLRAELEEATHLGLRVGVLSHVGLHPQTGNRGQCLLWNYDEVLDLLHSPEGSCVQFVFNGHRHDGGFVTDEHGIHHCCFETPLHSGDGEPGCFALVEIGVDQVVIKGFAPSRSEVQTRWWYGRTLDAEDAFALHTRSLPLRRS